MFNPQRWSGPEPVKQDSGNEDRYWKVGYGKYRLYDPERDKV